MYCLEITYTSISCKKIFYINHISINLIRFYNLS